MRTLTVQASVWATRGAARVTGLAITCALVVSVSAMAYLAGGDREALQGSWQVMDARAEVGGGEAMVLTDIIALGTISFVSNKMTMRDIGVSKDSISTFTFMLDTAVSPRHIDMVGEGSSEGIKWSGIYRIMGDSLWLTLPIEHFSDRPDRPSNFGGSNTFALILRRGRR
jgi:uncharacterized protein (TIGR03067 family)